MDEQLRNSLTSLVKASKKIREIADACNKVLDKDEIETLVKELLLFCEDDGTVVNGFRTKETILRLKELVKP